jgi:hypothetical protein
MKIRENYLHYGVYIQSERVLGDGGNNKKKRSKSAGEEDEDEGDIGLVPVLNINRTIEDIVNEYGLSVAFVIRRRIFSIHILLNCEAHLK